MNTLFKDNPSYVVSEAALDRKGHFLVDDILEDVKKSAPHLKVDKDFVIKKLNTMCEVGMIGSTSMYYFSRND